MIPYSYTADQAGITGAALIVAGLIATAILCPIVDRTHAFLLAIKVQVPIIAAGYIVLIFAVDMNGNLVFPILIAAILGAASFSLLPLVLEWVVEMTHPAPPEITSAILWAAGQLTGGIFILVMDAMKDKRDGGKMRKYVAISPVIDFWRRAWVSLALTGTCGLRSLIFEAVIGAAVFPLAFLLGRGKKGVSGRIAIDQASSTGSSSAGSAAALM